MLNILFLSSFRGQYGIVLIALLVLVIALSVLSIISFEIVQEQIKINSLTRVVLINHIK